MKWRTGRPDKDGEYIVTKKFGNVGTLLFTTDGGWNTRRGSDGEVNHEYRIEDSYIRGWINLPDPMPETPDVVWSE